MRAIEDIMNCKKIAWKHVADDGASGTYYTHKWTGSIIFSTGAGWEHVSVAPFKRSVTPSWDDMCEIKNIFWGEDEAVIEVHMTMRKTEAVVIKSESPAALKKPILRIPFR